MAYSQHFSTLKTPQSEQATTNQVRNSAGGYVFQLDKWKRLERWLILGCEGGTYYASERELTRDNAKTILECLAENGDRTVATIVEISESGRAPKNAPAVFALAVASGDANLSTRKHALAAMPRVCRTGTDLFHFVRDAESFRRWGRAMREGVACWYNDKDPSKLAYQIAKYQQRDGWSHRDLLRLCHAKPKTPEHETLFRYVTQGVERLGSYVVRNGDTLKCFNSTTGELPRVLAGLERVKTEKDPKQVARLAAEYGLTHEMVPSEAKNSPEVWDALLESMPMTAMIRNLAKMTAVGLIKPLSSASNLIVSRLIDPSRLRGARVHPIALLSALNVYKQGHGEKGKLTWQAERSIVDALDDAFYLSFKSIEPTGKNTLLAIDVSGSMDGGVIAGCPGITPRIGAAAMAMATARVETNWAAIGFTAAGARAGGLWGGGESGVTQIAISPKQRLDDVAETMRVLPMGGTDCALPMLWAQRNKVQIDTFVIYTDNETWAGGVHPFQALRAYRQASGRPAKLIVVGMTSNGFTIADPNDAGMMDCVGFDSAAPAIMADFARK